MNSIHIITTKDGSHSLLNEQLNETYHSVHGAVQESQHVFIENGLHFLINNFSISKVKVLEIGFGTGLNAWLTWNEARNQNLDVQYTSLEAFPVEEHLCKELNYAEGERQKDFMKMHEAVWDQRVAIDSHFTLEKVHTTLQHAQLSSGDFDLIYFDAFAPNKQPELWELPMLQKVVDALKSEGVWVTYCAKGQLKRDLKSLGMRVETLQGPPGKREMVRAIKS